MSVRVERPAAAGARQAAASPRETLDSRGAWALVGVLFGLVAIALPELGSDPWRFLPPSVDPQGLLASAGAGGGRGMGRGHRPGGGVRGRAGSAGPLALFLLARRRPAALPALDRRGAGPVRRAAPERARPPSCSSGCATPPRPGSSPTTRPTRSSWAATCCSTSTTRTATTTASPGSSASTPATAACRSGCASARWPSSTSPTSRAACWSAAPWRLLPDPFDDFRLLVLLSTLALLSASRCSSEARSRWRLALGAVLVCNPIAVRSAWFGQNDAPSLLLLVLAFALVTRRRFAWAAAALAGAVLLKQFALVAAPFLALMIVKQGGALKRPALAFGGVLAAGHPALPGRRSGRLLRGHRALRGGHLQDRRLRPVGNPGPPRDPRRP